MNELDTPPSPIAGEKPKSKAYVWLQRAAIVIMVVLFAICIRALIKEFHTMRSEVWWEYLRDLPRSAIVWSLVFCFLSYLFIAAYEMVAVINSGERLPFYKVALASFVSISMSHNTGMSLFASSSMRFRFMSRYGVPPASIPAIVTFSSVSYAIGVIAAGAVFFLIHPLQIPSSIQLPFGIHSTRALGWICLALLLGYFSAAILRQSEIRVWKFRIPFPGFKRAFAQAVFSAIELIAAAACMYVLLPKGDPPILFYQFVGVYLIASVLGLAANVPGGLGVVEATVLLLIGDHFETGALLGPLILFRIIYYLLTLVIGLILLFIHEGFHIKALVKDITGKT
jgi:uncharacterized membrane protein YbhN (UPF0104 family)